MIKFLSILIHLKFILFAIGIAQTRARRAQVGCELVAYTASGSSTSASTALPVTNYAPIKLEFVVCLYRKTRICLVIETLAHLYSATIPRRRPARQCDVRRFRLHLDRLRDLPEVSAVRDERGDAHRLNTHRPQHLTGSKCSSSTKTA